MLDGWEGPLDLLLDLARRAEGRSAGSSRSWTLVPSSISVSSTARPALKLELAADYLVMAAWLAYLKSALLLPADPEADPSARRSWPCACNCASSAWRRCARPRARLLGRDRLGRDVFAHGQRRRGCGW
jgi:segregation and condensation protein A